MRPQILLAPMLVMLIGAGPGCGGETDVPAAPTAPPPAESDVAFGYEKFDALLGAYVDDRGLVDYGALQEDRGDLDAFIRSMGSLDEEAFDAWAERERLAFWINAYNAITLLRIIDHYPIEKGGLISAFRFPANSIRQISGVWTDLTTAVMGKPITLDRIEHEILREEFREPRIHAAIVCAARSCPPLRNEAFRAERLEEQLAEQSRRFLASDSHFRIDREREKVYLSPILDWFGEDFVGVYNTGSEISQRGTERGAALEYVSRYISDEDARFLLSEDYSVSFLSYDWTLNEQ